MRQTRFGLLLSALLWGAPLFAQGVGVPQTITVIDSGTACVTAPTACASFTMSAINVVAFDVSGTWTGTLTPEGSVNGAPFRTILTTNPADGSSTSAITANGTYTVPNSGFTQVRLRATAAITGTAFVGAAQGYLSARVMSPIFTQITGPTTCATPLYSFTGRTTTGVCSSAANTVDLSAGGTSRFSVSTTGITSTLPILAPDGLASAPSLTFTTATTKGFYSPGANGIAVSIGGSALYLYNTATYGLGSAQTLCWTSGADPTATSCDTTFSRSAAGVAQVKSQLLVGTSADAAAQYRSVQTLTPVCYVNCGTAPTVAGTDSDMIVTMGASGVPASLWQVGFRGIWASKPSCTGTMALGTMAIGKFPMVIVTTTGGLTVTTNGTAPATSDVYNIQCRGTQ